jgi:hypothetical protein
MNLTQPVSLGYCGGDEGARTPDLDSAIVALSRLSYVPMGETQYSTARVTAQGLSPTAPHHSPLSTSSHADSPPPRVAVLQWSARVRAGYGWMWPGPTCEWRA